MYFERKIDKALDSWLKRNKKAPALVVGIRQCGKTKLVKIGDYNVGVEGDVITIPHYLTFALGKDVLDF